MSLTFQDYLKAIKASQIQPIIQLEWLNVDGSTAFIITQDLIQTSGNLTINLNNGARRSFDITLYNVHKNYDITPDKLFFGQQVKLSLGIYINNEPYLIPQGYFYITNPVSISNFSEQTIQLNCVDKWSFLNGDLFGNLEAIYIASTGSNIYDVARSILVLPRGNGFPIDGFPVNFTSYYEGKTTTLPDSTVVSRLATPYELRIERGESYATILTDLATMLGGLIFYNENGQLTIEPSQDDIDDSNKGSLYDFTTEEFEYLGSSVEYKFTDVFNDIVVIGDVISGDECSARVQNTNIRSDTCIQKIGTKTKVFEDTNIYSDELAAEYGQYLLKRQSIMQKAVTIKCTPLYHLDVNKVITLSDPYLNFDRERFLIQSLNVPLSIGGQMEITATAVNELAFS